MKKLVVVGLVVVTAVLLFSQFGAAQTQKLIPINTAWMSEHELFFAWYAKEKGFDKQEGLDMKLLNFDSRWRRRRLSRQKRSRHDHSTRCRPRCRQATGTGRRASS